VQIVKLKHSILSYLRLNGLGIEKVSPFKEMVKILKDRQGSVRFLQVGANDGVSFDDFSELIKRYELTGVCIEPIPRYHEVLSLVYRDVPGVQTLNAAIHPREASASIYSIKPSKLRIVYQNGWASFNREHLKKLGAEDHEIQQETVACVTMAAVYEKYFRGEAVDVIQIDTEGFDAEVIKMIDFTLFRPQIIRFEHTHLSDQDLKETCDLLKKHGYVTRREYRDMLVYDPKKFHLNWLTR
jgi:FkbM family methyltransferase